MWPCCWLIGFEVLLPCLHCELVWFDLVVFLSAASSPAVAKDRLASVQEWLLATFYEFMADFTEEAEPEAVVNPDGDPLTVKK